MTNREILRVALAQSAVDCGCAPDDFLADQNVVCHPKGTEGISAYIELPIACRLISYGGNVVASCEERLHGAVTAYLDGLGNAHEAFETPRLYQLNDLLAPHDMQVRYQALYFLPDVDALFAITPRCTYELRVLGPEDFRDLYVPSWSNALCKERPSLDVLGVGAYDGDTLVGLAGCSADCARMWQIGIDVLPSHRRQGIATALTNRLARETFARDKIPFYCAAWSNVRSVRNALASGFKPAWVDLSARPMAKEKASLAS